MHYRTIVAEAVVGEIAQRIGQAREHWRVEVFGPGRVLLVGPSELFQELARLVPSLQNKPHDAPWQLTDHDVNAIREAEKLPSGVPYEGRMIQPSVHKLQGGGFDDAVIITRHTDSHVHQSMPRSTGREFPDPWQAEDAALAFGRQLIDDGNSSID